MASSAETLHDPLTRAIRRAQGNLLRLQHPDGYWCGELFVDSTLCSDYVLFMYWADERDPVLEEKCVAHIRRRQLDDGGWNIYEGGPSDINASVKAYFALKLAGHSPDAPWMREARACILRLGGIPRMNTYAKLYLALLGQFPWKYLPTVPLELVFFPRWLFFNIYELSSWSRAMLIPLAILNHFKPTRELPPEKQLHELYPVGSEQDFLGLHRYKPRLSWPNFFLVCDRLLKVLHGLPWKPWRHRAVELAEQWMVARMGEGSDGLAAIFPAMLNSIIALKTLGYPDDHPLSIKARRDFQGLFVDDPEDFRIQPCLSPVWDTAINLIALAASAEDSEEDVRPQNRGAGAKKGSVAVEEEDADRDPLASSLRRGVAWLESKEVRVPGDWCVKNPGVEPSGWAFEFNNVFYPDTDDTMMVLMALAQAEDVLGRMDDAGHFAASGDRAVADSNGTNGENHGTNGRLAGTNGKHAGSNGHRANSNGVHAGSNGAVPGINSHHSAANGNGHVELGGGGNGSSPDIRRLTLEARHSQPEAAHSSSSARSPLFERALRWLMSFQCRNGGWAAFDKDVTQGWLEDVPFADHNAILDPPCSDLTGRVLELLGMIGFPRDTVVVRRALALIRRTQDDDGSWYGRWGVNYVYGTWQILRGLRGIGEDMRQPWILRARDWLESCQNEDGGWGETCASYEDPTLKGKGPSTPSQTAWALMGLVAACDSRRPEQLERRAIRRGIEFLLERQNADGSWPEPETTGTGFPSVFYLRYDMYRNNWPLLALATWRKASVAAADGRAALGA